jgi:monoterpene epsilon-lactone hydrolase
MSGKSDAAWIETIPPVAGDDAIVSGLLSAARNVPDTLEIDIEMLRRGNPERLRGPLIRQAVNGTQVESVSINGVGGEWISVPGGSDKVTILYFHGGAFIRGSLLQGRGIASSLALAAHGRAFALDYRQAPEHKFPAPIEDGVAVYRGLLSQGIDPRTIVFAGDSCGGAIPVSTLIEIRNAKVPMPAACISISPFADLTSSGETRHTNARTDIVGQSFSIAAAKMYLGDRDARHPLASPIFADLKDLPPMLVIVGTDEALYSDAEALVLAARKAGVDVTQQNYTGMIHVFPMFTLRTGDTAIRNMADFIARHVPH